MPTINTTTKERKVKKKKKKKQRKKRAAGFVKVEKCQSGCELTDVRVTHAETSVHVGWMDVNRRKLQCHRQTQNLRKGR